MRWTRARAAPPRRQPLPYPAVEEPEGAISSGCAGTCLGVLASSIAFVALFTLGSIVLVFESPDREAVYTWLAVAAASWLLSGLVAYFIAGHLGASPQAMALGALVGFVLPFLGLVVFVLPVSALVRYGLTP